jgi:hypothetical protein
VFERNTKWCRPGTRSVSLKLPYERSGSSSMVMREIVRLRVGAPE